MEVMKAAEYMLTAGTKRLTATTIKKLANTIYTRARDAGWAVDASAILQVFGDMSDEFCVCAQIFSQTTRTCN